MDVVIVAGILSNETVVVVYVDEIAPVDRGFAVDVIVVVVMCNDAETTVVVAVSVVGTVVLVTVSELFFSAAYSFQ